MKILAVTEDYVAYMRTETPGELTVVDSDDPIFDEHFDALRNGLTKVHLVGLLDDISASRNAALKLDFDTEDSVGEFVYSGRIISVGDPKFEAQLGVLGDRARRFGNRLGVIEILVNRARDLSNCVGGNGQLQGYGLGLISYADCGVELENRINEIMHGLHELGEVDRKNLVEIADAVVDAEKYDHSKTLAFMKGIRLVMPTKVDERKFYLDRFRKHRRDGIDETVKFVNHSRHAFGMDASLRDSVNYASVNVALEDRFGEKLGEDYRNGVKLGLEAELPFNYAIKFGALMAFGKLDRAGKVIGNANGLGGNTAVGFGNIYYIAARKHGINNATRLFASAYFITLKKMIDFARDRGENLSVDLRLIAEHVDPVVPLVAQKSEYLDNFRDLVNNAVCALYLGISKSPRESFYVASRSIDIGMRGGNPTRWMNKVRDYISAGVRLDTALEVADEAEMEDRLRVA